MSHNTETLLPPQNINTHPQQKPLTLAVTQAHFQVILELMQWGREVPTVGLGQYMRGRKQLHRMSQGGGLADLAQETQRCLLYANALHLKRAGPS